VYAIGGEEFLVFRLPLRVPDTRTELSEAESEVAAFALAGLSNAEIGRRRGTSARTVANQIASIFRKLEVGSRAELARRLVGGTS
jgi:DNA-binding NarL/FixJ family response regulator